MTYGKVYAVKTTVNQERTVADMLAQTAEREDLEVSAILSPDKLRGYFFVEASGAGQVEEAVNNVAHARGVVSGESSISEVEHFLKPKPMAAGINEGDIVELVSGPFKGEKAVVKRIDPGHEEITLELFEAMVPIPVTVRGDSVRVLDRKVEE
ncbi:MAG: Transcription elongation factor Spt5 [Methanonatronarchaeales archaeon]|nr:Transcription elongation factor Spt5 [Methanonatronarchaeales archaeon]